MGVNVLDGIKSLLSHGYFQTMYTCINQINVHTLSYTYDRIEEIYLYKV